MARAVALAGFMALAAGQALAAPTVETLPHMGEWQEAAAETQKVAPASVTETNQTEGMTTNTPNTSMPRMMGTHEQPQQLDVQEAVLDAIMKEMQSVFKHSSTSPGWENTDSAADTVKQIVDRVHMSLTNTSETEAGRTPMTTTTALRGVTNDFVKEIMVQEAVTETLWTVLRETQARPWIANEQQAMHVAATQAVQSILDRMYHRLRATGFNDDEIMKMMPRNKNGPTHGHNGMFDTPAERRLGRRGYGGYYGGYGYGHNSYGYGYGYPSYGYGYGYPYYSRSYWYRRLGEMTHPHPEAPTEMESTPERKLFGGYRSYYGGWGYGYPSYSYGYPYYSRSYWYRRLGEMANPEGPNEMSEGVPERKLFGGYGSYYGGWGYGYPSYGYGYGYPYYSRSYWYRRLGEMGNPETATPPMDVPPTPVSEQTGVPPVPTGMPGVDHPEMMGPVPGMGSPERMLGGYSGATYYSPSWDYYPSYGYGWGYYPGYASGAYYPGYGYGRTYWRRLEVPDFDVPHTASTMASERITENTPATTSRTNGFTQNTFRRVGETRVPMTTGSYYVTPNNTPYTETPFYPEQTHQQTASNTWENTTY